MEEIQSLLSGATLSLELSSRSVNLTEESLVIQRLEKEHLKVLNDGSLTVALDSEINEELKQEGLVRDIVRSIQNLRKEADLEVTDRIDLYLQGEQDVREAVTAFEQYLKTETLAMSVTWEERDGSSEVDCGDETCSVFLKKSAG